MSQAIVHLGDSREVLKGLADCSVDAVVTDPPYELGFMGKSWDSSGIAYDVALWREVLRVLKPGGYLLAFGATRTYHRLAVAIEDAGFEIRDSIHWLYGTGFPKSLDISKALDRQAGAVREVVGEKKARLLSGHLDVGSASVSTRIAVTAPATDAARAWDGWGTALKPAHEPIVVARKPLDGTVADNVLAHGVGGINVGACRVAPHASAAEAGQRAPRAARFDARGAPLAAGANDSQDDGRWPPNVLLSHLPDCEDAACAAGCAVAEVDAQGGGARPMLGEVRGVKPPAFEPGASRFFPGFRYQAKPTRSEKERGLITAKRGNTGARRAAGPAERANIHPTVKPLELMRWCVRLITPKRGVVLDPFTGSGTTGMACVMEGMSFVGVELSEEYRAIALARIKAAQSKRSGEQLSLLGEEGE